MTTLQALIIVPMNEDGIERADKFIAEMFEKAKAFYVFDGQVYTDPIYSATSHKAVSARIQIDFEIEEQL